MRIPLERTFRQRFSTLLRQRNRRDVHFGAVGVSPLRLQLIILPDFVRVEHSIAVEEIIFRTIALVSDIQSGAARWKARP